ncbi:MAG: ERF family protein [Bacilli bacterium]
MNENHSNSITEIAKALLEAQKAIEGALKKTTGVHSAKYADLTEVIDSVKKPLNDNGITILQAVNGTENNGAVVETMLLHTSGEYVKSITPVYCAKPNDPQAFGSGVTYSKRYALQALLGLPTYDDDGETAKVKPKPEPKTPLEITNQAFLLWQAKYPKSKKTFKQFQADVIKISPTKKLPTTKASIPQIIDTIKPDEEDGLMGIDEVTPPPSKGWECASCGERYLVKPKSEICEKCEGFLNELQ